MRGNRIAILLLAAGLSACASNGVQPGIVSTSSGGTQTASAQSTVIGSGRVVSVNEVNLAGSGGSGSGRGPLIGGLMGAVGGAAIGAGTRGSLGAGIIGGVLGAVGGAIAGAIFDSGGGPMSGGRGIEVTVQKDDGQTVTIAQHDDGDVQLGDRVQIVQNGRGVAKAVRDNSRQPDNGMYGQPPSQQDPYAQSPGYQGPPPGYQGGYRTARGPGYQDPYSQAPNYPGPNYHGPMSRTTSGPGYQDPGSYQSGNYSPQGYSGPTRTLD